MNFQKVQRVLLSMASFCKEQTDNDSIYNDDLGLSARIDELNEVIEEVEKLFLKTQKFVVWNPSKVSQSCEVVGDGSTYNELLDAEMYTGNCMSSIIHTADIVEYITSVHNEADVRLSYQRIG